MASTLTADTEQHNDGGTLQSDAAHLLKRCNELVAMTMGGGGGGDDDYDDNKERSRKKSKPSPSADDDAATAAAAAEKAAVPKSEARPFTMELQNLSGIPPSSPPKIINPQNGPIPDKGSYDPDAKHLPQFIQKLPPQSMTGVAPFMTRLCATVTAGFYINAIDKSGKIIEPKMPTQESFQNLTAGYTAAQLQELCGLPTEPELVYFSAHGIYGVTNPPVTMVVADTTMIIAWRGSTSIEDFVRDVGFYISSSQRWKKCGQIVKCHGGFLSLVENFMIDTEAFILKTIQKRKITELIFTGHSLGGGVAQVAHLWTQGSMTNVSDANPWKVLEDKVTIRTIAFEAPMSTAFLQDQIDNLTGKKEAFDEDAVQVARDFVYGCAANMCNTCFQSDIVPQLPGNPKIVIEVLDSVVTGLKQAWYQKFLPRNIVEREVAKFIVGKVINTLTKLGERRDYCDVLQSYQHIGRIIYYASYDALPVVYVDDRGTTGTTGKNALDLATFFATPDGLTPPQFNNGTIKWVLPESSDEKQVLKNIADTVLYDHNFINTGPGLTLSWNPAYA